MPLLPGTVWTVQPPDGGRGRTGGTGLSFIGWLVNQQFLSRVRPPPLVPKHWVTWQYLPCSTNTGLVQHWPGPLGVHARAGANQAEAVTNDTARIGINIVGFIVVSGDRSGRPA